MTTDSRLKEWAEDLGWDYRAEFSMARIYHPDIEANNVSIEIVYAADGRVRSARLHQHPAPTEQIKGGVPAIMKIMASMSHYPRFDTSSCPFPDDCEHTTEFEGESCECCGKVISHEP